MTEEEEFMNEQKMSRLQYNDQVNAMEAAILGSDAAKRLAENPDFQMLILQDYFIHEPARIAGMMASPKMISAENRQILTEDLIGIGKLRNMLSSVSQNGDRARAELEELKNYVSKHGLRD